MKRVALSVCLALAALTAVGCSSKNREIGPYFEDGRQKPAVAVVPVVDYTQESLPWNLSQELTCGIKETMVKDGAFFLYPESASIAVGDSSDFVHLVEKSVIDLKTQFPASEFVVLMELLEHKEVPNDKRLHKADTVPGSHAARLLHMRMRIQVIDIRGTTPTVVLREVVESNFPVYSGAAAVDYGKQPWGTRGYWATILGMAHHQLEHDITGRLATYIMLARSRPPV